MNHDPYEEWLLADEELTDEQQLALQGHLESCEECKQLASAWQYVQTGIRSLPEATPEPGFTQRWQARLAEETARKNKRWTWIALLALGGGALAAFLAIYLPDLSQIPSPIGVLSSLLYSTAVLLSTISDIQIFIEAFLHTVPLGFSILLWIVVSTSLCLWGLIWLVSIWRIPNLQRRRNEAHN